MGDKNGWLVPSTKRAPIIVLGAVHTTNNPMRWEHCPHFTYEETEAERGNESLPARKMASNWKGHNPKGQRLVTISVCYRISLSSWLWRSPGTKVPVGKGSEKRILIYKSRLCSEYRCSQVWLHLHEVCFLFSSTRMWLWRKSSLWLCESLEPQRKLVCWRRNYSEFPLRSPTGPHLQEWNGWAGDKWMTFPRITISAISSHPPALTELWLCQQRREERGGWVGTGSPAGRVGKHKWSDKGGPHEDISETNSF